jgi:threonine/homoserine/homoserine lactone efflux protein
MIMTLISSPGFLTFLLASLLLAIAPGPGVMYLLTRTLSLGRAAGLASVGGVAIGNLANAALASLGLAALMAASATAFTVVKFVGAAYLVVLAVQTLRAKPEASSDAGASLPAMRVVGPSAARVFRDGFLVALLNPKTALFFAALLPQFILPAVAPLPQTLFLGSVFVAIAVCTDTLYVCAAAAFAQRLKRDGPARGLGRYLAAATFMGLAAYAAFANPRATR